MSIIAQHADILLLLACIFGFFMAWGIGANDVANAMGTSVGSGAITIGQAVIIAGVFEFLGAYLAGGEVTATIRKGIIDPDSMAGSPELLVFGMLSALLAASAAAMPADFGGGLTESYLIVNAVDGLTPGAYYYSRESGKSGGELQLLKEGEFRAEAGHLCFEQALGADASAVVFFLADLDSALGWLGNRGYRAAQLEAGVMGGNVYIAAHSLGLGATGMTFFDDAVTAFFSPHAAGKSLLFLVGLGRTGTPNRVRPFRSKYGVLKDSLARGASGERRPVPDWLYSN